MINGITISTYWDLIIKKKDVLCRLSESPFVNSRVITILLANCLQVYMLVALLMISGMTILSYLDFIIKEKRLL